jgi:hypothetical protein
LKTSALELILYIQQCLPHEYYIYIMYNVQDNRLLNNNAVRPVVCEGCHVTHKWKALT